MDSWKDWFLMMCVIGLLVCGFFIYKLNDRVTELETYHDAIESMINNISTGITN